MNKRRAAEIFSVVFAILLLFPSILTAQEVEEEEVNPNLFFGLVMGRYLPTDAVFKEVYGESGSNLGFQAGWHFLRSGSFSLALKVGLEGFTRTGTSTITAMPTTLSLKPFRAGLEVHLQPRVVGLWAEAGIVSISYHEQSELQDTQDTQDGIYVGGGLLLQIPSFPWAALQAYARWSKAVVTTTDLEADLGGTEFGLSLLLRLKI
jgi:hypothetical protein